MYVCVFRGKATAKPPPDPRLPPPSCLLLPPTPKRGGQKAAVSSQTNMHILVDAGLKVHMQTPPTQNRISFHIFLPLIFKQYKKKITNLLQLLHFSLKKSRVTSSDDSALEMLDPFILLLLECLNSTHVKVRAYMWGPLVNLTHLLICKS